MPKYLVQHRRGTAARWAEKNTLIPREGEIVIEIDEVNSLHKLKIGDGIHTYAELAYLKAGDEIVTQVLTEAKPRVVSVELTTNWHQDAEGKYSQVIALENITKHSRLDLQPSVDMIAEFKQLGLVFVTENNDGVITVYSVGNVPSQSYTMQATIVETECDGGDTVIGIPIGASAAQTDWLQTDETKVDYIKNKPILGALAEKDEVTKTDLAADVQTSLDAVNGKASSSDLTTHTSNKFNPHSVTLTQLGVTATATELNYMDGVTSNVQTQISSLSSEIAHKQNAISTEIWTFTLEDGSVVKKAVYAENAQKTITMSVGSGSPSANVTCNGQTYYGSTLFNANIGDVLTVDIQGYTGITLTVNGVVIRETFAYDTYVYEHIVTGNTRIDHAVTDDGRGYVNITEE